MVDILILFQDDGEELATRIAWAAAERGYSVWGDPNHFKGAPDEELAAAVKAARVSVLLWTPGLVTEASRRSETFANLEAKRAVAALLSPGLEPPGPWRDRPNDDLSRLAEDPSLFDSFLERVAATAGAATGRSDEAAVDRLRAAEEDAAAWRAVRGVSAPEAYDAYLDRFGSKGLFFGLARRRRAEALAARREAGEAPAVGPLGRLLWVGAGVAGAAAVFGALALLTGGDLRTLSGAPTEEALALQDVTEISSDLNAELIEARAALAAAEEALAARDAAVGGLEIALAKAQAGGAQGGATESAVGEETAALRTRLEEVARARSALEGELTRKEAALRSAERRAQQAEAAAEAARRLNSGSDSERVAALEEALAGAQAETRRANAILQSARLRIEALETARLTRRRAEEEGGSTVQVAAQNLAPSRAETARAEAGADTQPEAQSPAPSQAAAFDAAPSAAPIPRRRPR